MRRRTHTRLMSDINVVPYIDVMLVLLIIFMITAPLVSQGVKVDLPQAPSELLPPDDDEPIVVSVDVQGNIYMDAGGDPEAALEADEIVQRASTFVRQKPELQFLVRGDNGVNYGRVVEVMALLQQAGVPGVGLITDPPAADAP